MKTITQAILELKDSLKDSTKITIEEFNHRISEVYSKLVVQFVLIEERAKDKKDEAIMLLHDKYHSVEKLMDDYKKLGADKLNIYSQNIVHKLSELNEKIEEYNKKHNS